MSETQPADSSQRSARSTAMTIVWGVIVCASLVGVGWLIWNRESILAWLRDTHPLAFFVAMALLPCIGAPITPFFLVAGATFGVSMGLIGSLLALAANLTITYSLARTKLRPYLERILQGSDYQLPELDQAGRKSLRFALLTKAAPGVPAFVKAYVMAMAGVPFAVFFGIGMLVTGAYGTALVLAGESLFDHDLRPLFAVLAVATAAVVGAAWWKRRRASRLESAPTSA